MIIRLIGWHEHIWLSLVNGGIMAVGIWLALKKRATADNDIDAYEDGFSIAFWTGVNATIIFTAFMAVWIYQFDPTFQEIVIERWARSYDSGPVLILFSVFLGGLATSVSLALIYMQTLKTSWNTTRTKREVEFLDSDDLVPGE